MDVRATIAKQQHRAKLGFNARQDYRSVAIGALANEFLLTSDATMQSLEERSFMLDTTVPLVVMSLEKLLKEAESRFNLDEPPVRDVFDPVNWIAQYLFRNNPKYSNFTQQHQDNPYQTQMKQISLELKEKLAHKQARDRKMKREIAEITQREFERQRQVAIQKLEEKRAMFKDLFTSLFRTWVTKLWRFHRPYLSRNDLVDTILFVVDATEIQAKDEDIQGVRMLLSCLSMSSNNSSYEAARTITMQYEPIPTEDGRPISATTLLQTLKETEELRLPTIELPTEVFGTETWDQEAFIKGMMFLTDTWSAEQLKVFLKEMNIAIHEAALSQTETMAGYLYVPQFDELPDSPTQRQAQEAVAAWKNKLYILFRSIPSMQQRGCRETKSTLLAFSKGYLRASDILKSDGIYSNRPLLSADSLAHFLDPVLGENEAKSVPSTPASRESAMLGSKTSSFANLPGTAQGSGIPREIEAAIKEYISVVKVLVGLYGAYSLKVVMDHLRNNDNPDFIGANAKKEDSDHTEEDRVMEISALFIVDKSVESPIGSDRLQSPTDSIQTNMEPDRNSLLNLHNQSVWVKRAVQEAYQVSNLVAIAVLKSILADIDEQLLVISSDNWHISVDVSVECILRHVRDIEWSAFVDCVAFLRATSRILLQNPVLGWLD